MKPPYFQGSFSPKSPAKWRGNGEISATEIFKLTIPTLSHPQPITFYTGILSLGLLTAGAHLYLASQPDESLRFIFLLNGLGYLALLVAFVLPQLKKIHATVDLVFMGYTLLTIILWFFFGSPSQGGAWDPFDVLVKGAELLLIIQLLIDFRQTRSMQREG